MSVVFKAVTIGNPVRLGVTFRNEALEEADPTVVTCVILDPRLGRSTPTPTRATQGKYFVIVTPTLAGKWEFRFAGTGALEAAEEGVFQVANSNMI